MFEYNSNKFVKYETGKFLKSLENPETDIILD